MKKFLNAMIVILLILFALYVVSITTNRTVTGYTTATVVALSIIYVLSQMVISPSDGHIIPIIKGKAYHSFIPRVEGWKMVLSNKFGEWEPKMVEGKDPKGLLELLGYYVIGPIPFLFKVNRIYFRWEDWEPVKDGGGQMAVKEHEEEISSFYFQHPYAMKFTGVEDSERQELEVILQVTTRMVFPYRAVYMIQPIGAWFTRAKGMVQNEVRNFVSMYTYEDLYQASKKKNELVERLMSTEFNDELSKQTGVQFIGVEILEINVGEEDEELQKAQTEAKLEKLRAEAKRIKADADFYVRQRTEVDIERQLKNDLGAEGYEALKMQNLKGTFIKSVRSGDTDKLTEILAAIEALKEKGDGSNE